MVWKIKMVNIQITLSEFSKPINATHVFVYNIQIFKV